MFSGPWGRALRGVTTRAYAVDRTGGGRVAAVARSIERSLGRGAVFTSLREDSHDSQGVIYQGTLGTRARGGGYAVIGEAWFKVLR